MPKNGQYSLNSKQQLMSQPEFFGLVAATFRRLLTQHGARI